MIGIGAAHEQRRLSARAPGLNDIYAGKGREQIGQGAALVALDLFLGDDRDRTRHLVGFGGKAGRGNHGLGQHGLLRERA